jgi:7-alpha-hydroxysteroid dehydrogenase
MSGNLPLMGKVALVTGSGRGIGAGMARAFAEAGADVALTARTTADIEAVAAEIRAMGRRAIAVTVDLSDLGQLPGVIERTVSELGGLDILVNNAGGAHPSPTFADTTVELIETTFRLTVSASFELARLALPHMLTRPGASIINILSPGAYKAPRGNIAYYVSKAALSHMTKLMAADLGPKIRVNAIIPGPIETPALSQLMEERPEIRQAIDGAVRMRRIGTPADVGAAAVFLASPGASFITGALLPVTGGEVEEPRPVSPDL